MDLNQAIRSKWFAGAGVVIQLSSLVGWMTKHPTLTWLLIGSGTTVLTICAVCRIDDFWRSEATKTEIQKWNEAYRTIHHHPITRVYILGCIAMLFITSLAFFTASFSARIIAVTARELGNWSLSR